MYRYTTDARCALLAVGDASGAVSLVDLREGRMMFVTSAFHNGKGGGGEGVAAAAFCPSVVGIKLDGGSGGGGGGGRGRGGGGEESSPRRDVDHGGSDDDEAAAAGTSSPNPASASPASTVSSSYNLGAEVLVLASAGSALAFLDTANGTHVGSSSAMHPKTPSPALAVAPLTAGGIPPPQATAAAAFWFNGSRHGAGAGAGVGPAIDNDDDPAACCTAFIAVVSAEALRVYPANGAAKGERHTVGTGGLCRAGSTQNAFKVPKNT